MKSVIYFQLTLRLRGEHEEYLGKDISHLTSTRRKRIITLRLYDYQRVYHFYAKVRCRWVQTPDLIDNHWSLIEVIEVLG